MEVISKSESNIKGPVSWPGLNMGMAQPLEVIGEESATSLHLLKGQTTPSFS